MSTGNLHASDDELTVPRSSHVEVLVANVSVAHENRRSKVQDSIARPKAHSPPRSTELNFPNRAQSLVQVPSRIRVHAVGSVDSSHPFYQQHFEMLRPILCRQPVPTEQVVHLVAVSAQQNKKTSSAMWIDP
jgi:hypothetical protein